jgi:hypothetical protein
MTVAELEERMTEQEFRSWYAFFLLEQEEIPGNK